MEDRRKCKRYSVAYPIEGGRERVTCLFSLMDVSKGGVAFSTTQEVHRNDIFNFRIFLKSRMFNLDAIVIHVKHGDDDTYKVGARFLDVPEEFHVIFEKEMHEVTQVHRENRLYKRRDISFKSASEEYLKNH